MILLIGLQEITGKQQKEASDLKMHHVEQLGRNQAKHAQELEELRRSLEAENEAALVKERQMASSRGFKNRLEYQSAADPVNADGEPTEDIYLLFEVICAINTF